MVLANIGDTLSIIISYLDVHAIQNLQRCDNYIKNYIYKHRRFVATSILSNRGWNLYICDKIGNKYISVWRHGYCISFLPNIIDEDSWDYVIRYMNKYSPLSKYQDLIQAAASCCIS